jgi:hypothetical protein
MTVTRDEGWSLIGWRQLHYVRRSCTCMWVFCHTAEFDSVVWISLNCIVYIRSSTDFRTSRGWHFLWCWTREVVMGWTFRTGLKPLCFRGFKYIRLYITRAIGDSIGRTSSFESMSIYVLRCHDSNIDTLFQLIRRSTIWKLHHSHKQSEVDHAIPNLPKTVYTVYIIQSSTKTILLFSFTASKVDTDTDTD